MKLKSDGALFVKVDVYFLNAVLQAWASCVGYDTSSVHRINDYLSDMEDGEFSPPNSRSYVLALLAWSHVKPASKKVQGSLDTFRRMEQQMKSGNKRVCTNRGLTKSWKRYISMCIRRSQEKRTHANTASVDN